MARFIVIYDSCVLYPAPLRDLLMRLALTDLYQAKWTQEIHNEWIRNLLKNRPDLTQERLDSIRIKMDLHVRDCLVEEYEDLIEGIKLPDPNDRHVLANLSDFPSLHLAKYDIDAQHPDEFLRHLLDLSPARVVTTVMETRRVLKILPKVRANT